MSIQDIIFLQDDYLIRLVIICQSLSQVKHFFVLGELMLQIVHVRCNGIRVLVYGMCIGAM